MPPLNLPVDSSQLTKSQGVEFMRNNLKKSKFLSSASNEADSRGYRQVRAAESLQFGQAMGNGKVNNQFQISKGNAGKIRPP